MNIRKYKTLILIILAPLMCFDAAAQDYKEI